MAFVCKLLAQHAQAAPDTLLLGHGVTCFLVGEQSLQCGYDGRIYLLYQLASTTNSTYSVLLRGVRPVGAVGCPSKFKFFRTADEQLCTLGRIGWFLLPQLRHASDDRRSR